MQRETCLILDTGNLKVDTKYTFTNFIGSEIFNYRYIRFRLNSRSYLQLNHTKYFYNPFLTF